MTYLKTGCGVVKPVLPLKTCTDSMCKDRPVITPRWCQPPAGNETKSSTNLAQPGDGTYSSNANNYLRLGAWAPQVLLHHRHGLVHGPNLESKSSTDQGEPKTSPKWVHHDVQEARFARSMSRMNSHSGSASRHDPFPPTKIWGVSGLSTSHANQASSH